MELDLDDHGARRPAVTVARDGDRVGPVLDRDRLGQVVGRELDRPRRHRDTEHHVQQLARELWAMPEHLDEDLVLLRRRGTREEQPSYPKQRT